MYNYQDFSYTTLLEGMTSISALIHGRDQGINDRPIYAVLIDENKKRSKYREIGYLRAMSEKLNFSVLFVPSDHIEDLVQGSTHGGIVALCGDRSFRDCTNIPDYGFWVLSEGVEDPFNLGFTLRSLYASGVDGVLLQKHNCMCAAGVVSKSSAGTSEMLDIRECDSESAVQAFKQAGYRIVCAGIRDSVNIYQANLKKPLLLVIGGEKRGISRSVLDQADQIVRIDYGRNFNGSLTAASAATVIAFEVLHQNCLQ